MPEHDVRVEDDHIQRLIRGAPDGLIELIWNSLDAEADHVDVEVDRNDLDGLTAVTVRDDGLGMTSDRAEEVLTLLGGSWKQYAAAGTETKHRSIHGKAGEGRFKAFAIGGRLRIESVREREGARFLVRAVLTREHPKKVVIDPPEETKRPRGTTVTVEEISIPPAGLLSDRGLDHYTATFAVYLTSYPNVHITIDGHRLEPHKLALQTRDYYLEAPDGTGPIELTVIDWPRDLSPSIFMCAPEGAALASVPSGIGSPLVFVTAYAKWVGFRKHEVDLPIADAHPSLQPALEVVREQVREHVIQREAELRQSVIEEWKKERAYPYPEGPAEGVQGVTRDVFDVVATVLAPAVNSARNLSARKLVLQLLRTTLEQDPERLLVVLDQVLTLKPEHMKGLVAVLERTSLGSVIAAASRVIGRLDFLSGLEVLVFDPKTSPQVLERSHLHKILENEAWVFGEEFAIGTSNRAIESVLRAHLQRLGKDYPPAEEIGPDGKTLIPDLFLCRTIERGSIRDRHLVVELKRPSVGATLKELGQIETYAHSVAADDRFDKNEVHWDFALVTRAQDGIVRDRARSYREPGLVSTFASGKVRVWAWTWADVIDRAKDRMAFVRSHLDYEATEEDGQRYLRDLYASLLPPTGPADDSKARAATAGATPLM